MPLIQLSESLETLYRETILNNKYIRTIPTDKQLEFVLNTKREVMFGGAAGGGKSEALLMAGLQFVSFPEYHAIIFRRTFQDLSLPGALIERSKEWLKNTDAYWNDSRKAWRFPSGASLSFGYLDHEGQKFRYQSSEFHFVGFDELSQFSETQYIYLLSRNRKNEGCKIPLRMRSATNPGGVGHIWVKKRFINPTKEERMKDPEYGNFIPSRLEDNPHINKESYIENLNRMDPVQRKQLRDGDWEITESGNMFKKIWFNLIDRKLVPTNIRVVRFWDLAATKPEKGVSKDPDWLAGVKMGMDVSSGRIYILDVFHDQVTPHNVDRALTFSAVNDGINVMNYIEEEGGASGKLVMEHYYNMFAGYGLKGIRSTGDKVTRARPFSAAVERGNVYVVKADWNEAFFYELNVFPTGEHDDQVDAASGAYNQLVLMNPEAQFARL